MKTEIKPGQRVRFHWGLDEAEGDVLDIYGPPGHRFVLVLISVLGTEGESLGEMRINVRLDAVAPAA